ncbi:hypothetical protein OF83DRAFT_1055222 [Amylostereum chailletii]|nr:hypothetical protein OF83DRAFT_1055222 [Amylostereum chailletii]
MPGTVIDNTTLSWEVNVHWALYAQCAVWDTKKRGLDIWECIRPHYSSASTQPPNPMFWRYVGRR